MKSIKKAKKHALIIISISIIAYSFHLLFSQIMKKKKHNKIVNDYDKQKEKHLERLATKMLDNDEKLNKLKGKNINTDFLNLF